jgi:hypothetical protein
VSVKEKKPKKPKKPKVFNFKSWFISQLRSISRRYPPHYEAENKVKEVYYIQSKKGKPMKRVRFPCAICKNVVSKKQIVRDHISPVVNTKEGFPYLPNGEEDWNTYIKGMLVKTEEIQMICKPCHDIKCAVELKERMENRTKS